MLNQRVFRRICMILFALLTCAAAVVSASAEEVKEGDTYVFDRDANGGSLYLYQSPCMIGYDVDNRYGGNGSPIQAFVFSMYDTETEEHFPTYCTDINITAVQGEDYRLLNLEDSPFSGSSGGLIRAILKEGFYIIPIDGESDAAHADRVNAKAAALGTAAGIDDLTVGEAIAATQAAIWRSAHGPILSFPSFCKSIFNPRNTKYSSLCSYLTIYMNGKEAAHSRIQTVYDYLLSLDPVAASDSQKVVSPASFVTLHAPERSKNGDGSYNVTVAATVDVVMAAGDALTVEAALNGTYSANKPLSNGRNEVTLSIANVPEDLAFEDVTLSISGEQTVTGYFYFDAPGERGVSQSMVGYRNGRYPVYAEVTAQDSRILNILKTSGGMPLSSITFDIFYVANMEDAAQLPDAKDYQYPNLAEYTLITDENGRASLNFTQHGLPDGVYLVVERKNPVIVAPIAPFYLVVPAGSEYEITIRPKNEVKGGVKIEKDVTSLGNDESSVNVNEPHTWIIGTTIPEDIASGESYIITDELDHRLDYVGNVKVELESTAARAASVALENETHYILTVDTGNDLARDSSSDSLQIELTPAGMSFISAQVGNGSASDYMLRTYFDTKLNESAQAGEKVDNQAELEYVNSVNFRFKAYSDRPSVVTGGANLLKVDAQDHTKTLPGAVFDVYRAATPEETAAGGEDLLDVAGVAGKAVKVATVTSDEDGKAAIYGLAYGEYYLVETKAPAGYNLANEAIVLTIDASSGLDGNVVIVENSAGVLMPSTGGGGTMGYYLSGGVLVCIALGAFCRKRQLLNAPA